MNGKQEIESK